MCVFTVVVAKKGAPTGGNQATEKRHPCELRVVALHVAASGRKIKHAARRLLALECPAKFDTISTNSDGCTHYRDSNRRI